MNEEYLAECLEKFHNLPDQLQEMIGGFESCLKIKKLEDEFQVSLSFATILIAIGELTIDDLPDYLNLKFGLSSYKGKDIANRLEEGIFARVIDFIIANNPDTSEEVIEPAPNNFGPIVNMPMSEKRTLIIKTFSGEIVPALKAAPAQLRDFNIALFQAFNSEDGLDEKIENLLYINQEKLSDHHIILDGHPASPTIANWLKDFIKKYGSDLFDEVVLAEYLSQAPNVKQLKPEEKELVRKVLKLYRNLVFFPESMDGVHMEDWEIFPVDRNLLKDNKTSIKIAVKEEASVNTDNEEKAPLNPESLEKQRVLFDLQKTLSKYSQSSLEYKAISQEISRLSKK